MTFSVLSSLRRAFAVALLLALSCAMIPNASAQNRRKRIHVKGGAPAVSQAATQTPNWVFASPMPTAREGLAAVGFNNKLYALGGRNGGGNLNTLEVFNPSTNSWTTAAPLPTARQGLAAVTLDNKIYAVGGSNGVSLNTVEVYDPATNTWSTGTPMLTARAYLAAAVLGNKIYAVGGSNADGDLNTVEVFDPVANAWSPVAPTAIARNGTAVVVLNNNLYAIGGGSSSSETFTNRVEVYDPTQNIWTEAPAMLTARGFLAAAVFLNNIYAFHGRGASVFGGGFGPLARLEIYDPVSNSWSQPNREPSVFRQRLAASALDNKIYVLGGTNGAGFLNSMEVSTLPSNPGDVLISEFRFSGAGGAQDEFIELYNNTDASIYVGSNDHIGGWRLRTANGALDLLIPDGQFIPARGHYLIANSNGYSLGGYPNDQPGCAGGNCSTPNLNYAADIPETGIGLALFRSGASLALEDRLDAVGPVGEANGLYKEGNGVPAISGGAGNNYSFYRSLSAGRPADSNANESDFILVSTGSSPSGARLGAPAPENINSPVQRNVSIKASLVDPSCAGFGTAASACARVRSAAGANPQNAAFGTLAIRRKFTNMTGANVTRLRFRVVDITTTPEPGVADLRAVGGTGGFDATLSSGDTATIQRLTLEQPPNQTSGGGFNSTLSANTVTLGQPLFPNASINVEFILGVMTNGNFRFAVNVEALP
ncbi:MAG TPA: kelch repeat-containing protein [Pyrinomonadaceae bacterium]|nr:kelch repeat-containing protein [Pyrinomonadaceae bacterium]